MIFFFFDDLTYNQQNILVSSTYFSNTFVWGEQKCNNFLQFYWKSIVIMDISIK